MRSTNSVSKYFKGRCLNNEDFYALLTQSFRKRSLTDLERHLTSCSDCRGRLSGLRELLESDAEEIREAFPEPTPEQIEKALALVARAIRHPYKSRYWTAAVATALV